MFSSSKGLSQIHNDKASNNFLNSITEMLQRGFTSKRENY